MNRVEVTYGFLNKDNGMLIEHTNLKQLLFELTVVRGLILPTDIDVLLLLNPVLDLVVEDDDGDKVSVQFTERRVSTGVPSLETP